MNTEAIKGMIEKIDYKSILKGMLHYLYLWGILVGIGIIAAYFTGPTYWGVTTISEEVKSLIYGIATGLMALKMLGDIIANHLMKRWFNN